VERLAAKNKTPSPLPPAVQRIPDVSPRRAKLLVYPELDGNRATLRRRRFGPIRGAIGTMLGVPRDVTAHLDPLATQAVLLMDGTRTVGEIYSQLVATHPDESNIQLRLGRLVGTLYSQRFLSLD